MILENYPESTKSSMLYPIPVNDNLQHSVLWEVIQILNSYLSVLQKKL
jgi:hypothetical protein